MESKLKSYFYTGNFSQLLNITGKPSEPIALLMDRASVMLNRTPSSSHANLKALSDHLRSFAPVTVEKGPLEEILNLIVLFNTDQEAAIIDSTKPDSPEKLMILSAAMIKLNRPEVAEKALQQVLSQDDEDGGLGLIQACVCFAKGEFEEASSLANELIAKYGESPVLLNVYALSLIHEQHYTKAEGLLRRSIDLSRELSLPYFLEFSLSNLIACRRLLGEPITDSEA
jgi:tetratricopeptide (TPR) repeat protein